jgi:hypothetical protein
MPFLYSSSTSEAGRLHGVAGANPSQKRVAARWFPESRKKAYYLISIHEHLPPQVALMLGAGSIVLAPHGLLRSPA